MTGMKATTVQQMRILWTNWLLRVDGHGEIIWRCQDSNKRKKCQEKQLETDFKVSYVLIC